MYHSINYSQKYPGLEKVLQVLTQRRDDLQHLSYSPNFTYQQIQALKEGVLRAHDDEPRKKGGYYINEHIVPIAEKSIQLGVIPAVTGGILLHDTIEDTDKDAYILKTPTLGERNLGILRESLIRANFPKSDRRLIVALCGILTKLSNEKIQTLYGYNLNEFELTELRFNSKIERALGSNDWRDDSFFNKRVRESHRFGAQICALLDIDNNFDPDEEIDRSNYDEEVVRRFYENKPRNLARALVWGKKLDSSIRELSSRDDCIINMEDFNKFIDNHYIIKLEKGLERMFKITNSIPRDVLRYWNL
ncbi:MAG: hypothetical protein ACMXYB_00345 [Candidatus Woesearchaeota archaeon]